jgi:hypothetical protein
MKQQSSGARNNGGATGAAMDCERACRACEGEQEREGCDAKRLARRKKHRKP